VLVAIASYGTGQDHYLREVVAGFRQLDMDCRIVVLSNIDKPVDGAEVLVGLPSRDTYSLPFAHRALFIKHASEYDLFIYTEDDTPITPANVRAFLETQQLLPEDHVPGFLRSETYPEGGRCIVSVNHHFRWLPGSAFTRSGQRFAQFSNQHSGCFIVTRAQLARAIASGGFTTLPRSGRYGMLETAASDIYTQCGLTRVICLSRIEDFIVPHLANKYFRMMGLPEAEFAGHVRALARTDEEGGAWTGSLFQPETRAPGFRWSKHLYRPADAALLRLVPPQARRVLSIGATTGLDEAVLVQRGVQLTVLPLDPVFGAALAAGLDVRTGPLGESMGGLAGAGFDAILIADALHLLPDPLAWLRAANAALAPGGSIVGSVASTSSWLWPLRDWRCRQPRVRPSYGAWGAHPMSGRRLASLARAAGLKMGQTIAATGDAPAVDRLNWAWARRQLAPRLLFCMQRPHERGPST
jgi:SAM-dependent methyltransferase